MTDRATRLQLRGYLLDLGTSIVDIDRVLADRDPDRQELTFFANRLEAGNTAFVAYCAELGIYPTDDL